MPRSDWSATFFRALQPSIHYPMLASQRIRHAQLSVNFPVHSLRPSRNPDVVCSILLVRHHHSRTLVCTEYITNTRPTPGVPAFPQLPDGLLSAEICLALGCTHLAMRRASVARLICSNCSTIVGVRCSSPWRAN